MLPLLSVYFRNLSISVAFLTLVHYILSNKIQRTALATDTEIT